MSARTPSYRLHKSTGQAVVTLDGRDRYLGKFGSAASRAEYDRLVATWLNHGRRLPGGAAGADPSVNEIILGFVRHAEGYYRKDDRPTNEVNIIKAALRPLRQLHGPTPARDFGPLALKAVRQTMIEADLCRNEVNRRTRIVVRAFKWATENELVPPSVHHGLKAVSGLRKGRSAARESEPVRPVPEESVDAIRPHVSRQVWAMIELQRLSAMRPGETTLMRTADIDRSGLVWAYLPGRHKTEHHGKARAIYFGPRAQKILQSWLRTDPDAYLFSPAEATAERRAAQRVARKSKVQPSQVDRRKSRPRKRPGLRYTTDSYGRAIVQGCKRAGIAPWHPNQLRHNAATWLRREFGIDVARVILGHSSPTTTEIYAEVDRDKAVAVMGRVG